MIQLSIPEPRQGLSAEIKMVKGAQYLLHSGPDPINACLRAGTLWESRTLMLAQTLLGGVAAPVVIDVGANLGAFSVPMGRWLARRAGQLVAFEPQRLLYDQLCGGLFLNQLGHCQAHLLAVGEASGWVDVLVLNQATEGNLGGLSLDVEIRKNQRGITSVVGRTERVPMVALSHMDLPAAHLIKIAVEGLELEVLTGARAYLQRSGHPPVLFEVWAEKFVAYRAKRERLLRYVRETLGYETVILGEMCVAQHPGNKRFEPVLNADHSVSMNPLSPPSQQPAKT